MQKITIFLTTCFFMLSVFVEARRNSNVFKSSLSDVEFLVKGRTASQQVRDVRQILRGREKWLNSFLAQNPQKLSGVFNFDGKINVVGIAYSTNSSKARAAADDLCLKTMAEYDIEQVGVYSKYLRVNTKNGYFIYAIIRSPVSSGFRSMDFNTGSSEVDELFK